MSPVLLLIVLVAALIGLIPVWRLRVAGWPQRWLATAWVLYAGAIFLAVRAPIATRFLLPILVLAYVAPFVAGPERLTRVLRGPGEPPRPVIDVTPRPPDGLPDGDSPERDDEPGGNDAR
ncbi:MAG TPA: hypothetical protein VGK16_05715 [Candidatus Limnocylindrales bacterium]